MANYTWMTTTALSATAADFGKEVMNNFFDSNVTFKAIKKLGGIVDRAGGSEFTVPAIKESGNAQWFTRSTKLNDTMPDPVHTLTYEMKYLQIPIKIYWTDEVENRGSKQKIFDFVKTQKEVASLTAEDEIEAAMWRAVPLADSIHSIPEIIDSTDSLGETDPSIDTWWAAREDAVGSFATNGLDKMQEMLTALHLKKSKLSVIFMGATVYNYFIKEAESKHLLTNDGSKMGFGVGKVPFASIPIEVGTDVTAGEMFFVDMNTIKCRRNSSANAMTEWHDMENELARKAHMLFAMQMYCQIRRRNGKLTGITA